MQKLTLRHPYYLVAFILIPLTVGAVGLTILRANGDRLLSIQSRSMEPILKRGDAVVIEPISTDQIHAGMIVTLQPSTTSAMISHRVVSLDKNRGLVTTKGDNSVTADFSVPAYQVVGEVTVVAPGLGRVLDFGRNPLGLALVVYLPSLIVIIAETYRLSRYYARPMYLLDYRYESKRQQA